MIRINQVQVKELRALRTMVEDQNTKIASLTTAVEDMGEGEIESHIVPKKSTESLRQFLVSCLSYTTQYNVTFTFSLIKPGQSEDIVWFHGRSGVRVVTKVHALQCNTLYIEFIGVF